MAFYITLSSALFLSGKLAMLLLHSLTSSMYKQFHEIESSSFWAEYYGCKRSKPKFPKPPHRNNPHHTVGSSLVYSITFLLGSALLILEFLLIAFQMRCYLDMVLAIMHTGLILSGYCFASILDEHDMWLGIVPPLPPLFNFPCSTNVGFVNPGFPSFPPCLPNCRPSIFNLPCYPERHVPWFGQQNWGNVQSLPPNVYFGMMQEQQMFPHMNQQINQPQALSRPNILPYDDEVMALPEIPFQHQQRGICRLS